MYDEYEDDDQTTGPKALRDALAKANKRAEEAEKAAQDIAEKFAALEKAQKSQSLTQLLTAKGVNPKLAKWLDKDGVEPSEEAVDAWIEENGEFFNIKPSTAENTANEASEPGVAPENGSDPYQGLPPEVQAALSAMQNSQNLEASATSTPSAADPKAEGAALAVIEAIGKNATSLDDVLSSLQKLGAPIQSGV